ncbi:g11847 [Coccomyxa viridis]|uniref:G11847 protein n=1 Tax=Coccomyxa viridis TaxID=1274662 RepID=A0ABP1G8X3_9CHLO
MCTALFFYDIHPTLLFLLAFNREEYQERPTEPAHFWQDHPDLLAARDLKGGGTWLGVTRSGRVAWLTNFREPAFDRLKDARSRGALPVDFLNSTLSPMQYLRTLRPEEYNGFNLCVADLVSGEIDYLTNRGKDAAGRGPLKLEHQLYGLSNGVLQDMWPKVEQGKQKVEALMEDASVAQGSGVWDSLFDGVLGDRAKVTEESQLPQTGMPASVEQELSSIFVEPFQLKGAEYGTRSQTVLLVRRDGFAELRERTLARNAVAPPRLSKAPDSGERDPVAPGLSQRVNCPGAADRAALGRLQKGARAGSVTQSVLLQPFLQLLPPVVAAQE